MTSSSNFFDVFLFLLSSLVTGPSFMSMSSLVLDLWQFSFIKDWPEIRKSEIPTSEFCPISEDWGKLGILNLALMFLIKFYWLLQSARVTAFTASELLKERGGGKIAPPTHPQIRVNRFVIAIYFNYLIRRPSVMVVSILFRDALKMLFFPLRDFHDFFIIITTKVT